MPDSFRILQAQIIVAMFQGQLMLAKELAAQYASEVTSRTGLKASAATTWSNVAQVAALYGDAASTRAAVRTALDIDTHAGDQLNSAFALAAIGDFVQARALLAEVARSPQSGAEDVRRGLKLVRRILAHPRVDALVLHVLWSAFVKDKISIVAGNGDVSHRRTPRRA